MHLFKRLFGASIQNESQLRWFCIRVTVFCLLLANASDLLEQGFVFVSWSNSLRSFAITSATVLILAVPISRAIGKAYLELHHAKLAADKLGRTDPLTGLPNRRALFEAYATVSDASLSLMIADIDRFKRINDSYGHLTGDEVISSIANLMRASVADLGMLVRLGGEEFALLTRGADRAELARRIEELRVTLANTPIVTSEHSIRATVSAGVAFARPGETFERLYAEADRALYAAKAAGRDRVLFADEIAALTPPARHAANR